MSVLFDHGLQPERTELAWRRTALAIGVGSIVAMRMLPLALGSAWWVLGGVVGLIGAAALWLAARRRYRRTTALLAAHGDRAAISSGGLILVVTAGVTIMGLACLAIVFSVALG